MAALFWSLLLYLPISVSCTAEAVASASSVQLVYQYQDAVWVENLAVRPNGWILPATATSAILTQLNPANGQQQVIHDWSAVGSSIMSITDVQPDLFLANTMYCDLLILECTPGTGITWLVDLRNPGPPCITELARGPSNASLLNGVAALNDAIVLMVDQNLGGIWGVDVVLGGAKLLFTDPKMMDPNSTGNGVNGIRVVGNTLYYNNPSIGTFGRVTLDPITGAKLGPVTVISTGLECDDFEIDNQQRYAYITNQPDELLRIDLETGLYTVFATGLPGPTSARWISQQERGKVLYVSTTGGLEQWLEGNVTLGGAFYEVTV
ncbi:uncharacterized protein Z520_10854 [Fonsecaea multimorphosa CBS 102226]|uniref:SMP-30/Gluconolactonase/LRE-like region domain-containing protein n=1 Tax=Fonsecaea multimorphosa CBS 102226 TaxID=1442371 RepID=A0A0D2GV71_9EURO|nr:uncharacterized protein Z520_10854 [Fonsecaea multimorphosa CBS 102226]KIX93435.1 hypothetical protein Z520_10854 [Fonsecaea multimorphosa CBS 102226]OAL18732.1 hypothetical protein AYO22_10425 [Fonsecaea multimorphosa]